MKIITLTLNPAFDMHCYVDQFRPFHENIADITSFESGGKGVNISRALTYNGVENLAVIIVGDENSAEFVKMLNKDGIQSIIVETRGRIRENITLHSGGGLDETRISFHGFTCDKSVLKDIEEKVGEVNADTIITFTGSIPKGISVEDVKSFLLKFKEKGAKIVIDSRSFSLSDLTAFKPWFIKPNKDEAEQYLGHEIQSDLDGAQAAKQFYALGVENVVLSLGKDGAVLASQEGIFFAKPPIIDAISTIGAGDSMIAGFVGAYATGLEKIECLKRAVAYGTAACLQSGTRPPQRADIHEIADKLFIKEIN